MAVAEKNSGSPALPLGVLSIATYLNKKGHNALICDRMINYRDLEQEIVSFRPQVIGVSTLSFLGIADAAVIKKTAERYGIPVVIGGTGASLVAESVLKNGIADMVSVGEGELSWLDIASFYEGKLKKDEVRSAAYLDNGEITFTRRAEFFDLGELDTLDWSLVPVEQYFETYYGCRNCLHLYASVGCPGGCTFCFNPWFNYCKRRLRHTDAVIAEIKYLHDTYGMKGIYFADECFGVDQEWIADFCAKLIDAVPDIIWGCQTRADLFEKEDYELMYRSGCRWIFFGIETGSAYMQKKVNKMLDLEQAEKSVNAAYEAGINTIAAFIIALPGETPEQLRETVDFAKRVHTSQWQFNYYVPVPHSAMFNALHDRATLEKKLMDISDITSVMFFPEIRENYSEIPTRDLKVVRAYFMWGSFWAKGKIAGNSQHSFAIKTAKDAFMGIFGHGILFLFQSAFNAFSQFWSVMINRYCFPNILKKYGLK